MLTSKSVVQKVRRKRYHNWKLVINRWVKELVMIIAGALEKENILLKFQSRSIKATIMAAKKEASLIKTMKKSKSWKMEIARAMILNSNQSLMWSRKRQLHQILILLKKGYGLSPNLPQIQFLVWFSSNWCNLLIPTMLDIWTMPLSSQVSAWATCSSTFSLTPSCKVLTDLSRP